MIITPHLAWMHIPKTAGTTTDRLFIASGVPLIWQDSQSSPVKHLPVAEHPDADQLPLDGCRWVANFRRLPNWLISNHQHKVLRMELGIDPEPMRRGLFWRANMQRWLVADWWLERFNVTENWTLLRVEHLKEDFLKCLAEYEPIGFRRRLGVRLVQRHNHSRYDRDLSQWFCEDDLRVAYGANPRWAALERHIYGNLLID